MSDAFKTSNKKIDPETGRIEWDVQYTPVVEFKASLDELSKDFKKLISKYPQDDKLEKLHTFFKQFKKQTLTYLTRQYSK